MINTPAIWFIEIATGKKMSSLMSDKTGVSERTLRSFPFSRKTCQKIKDGSENDFEKLLKKSGYNEDEIKEIISNHPESAYAGIIYEYQVQKSPAIEFIHTVNLAKKIDDISLDLYNSWQKDDIEEFKNLLLTSEFGSSEYFLWPNYDSENEPDPGNLQQFKSAQCWKEIDGPLRIISLNCLFSLMAFWDLEFYNLYAIKYTPRSLFSLVLPKTDPLAEFKNDQEIKKRRGMFWLPTKRLIDLISCFGWSAKYHKFPDEIPKVSDGAFWGDETERNLVNWRDGTKRFLYRDFIRLWDINGKNLALPSPLFVAAKMWEISLVKIKDQTKTIMVVDEGYEFWWKKHYTDLASDLILSSESKDHWPKCFDII